MIKELVVGLVAVASTLGGSYVTMRLSAPAASGGDTEAPEVLKHVKPDMISVPILRNGKIDGYVIARVVASALAKDVDKHQEEVLLFVNAATFRTFYSDPGFDFAALSPVETRELASRIVKDVNARLGRDSVKEVIIESLNYMTPEEVRNSHKQ